MGRKLRIRIIFALVVVFVVLTILKLPMGHLVQYKTEEDFQEELIRKAEDYIQAVTAALFIGDTRIRQSTSSGFF